MRVTPKILAAFLCSGMAIAARPNLRRQATVNQDEDPLPNIVIVMIDDLGYNQVGYHAEKVGNDEVQTPFIDEHAKAGIKMKRGYMTPWCAPSRAAFQTGTMNSFNGKVSNDIYAFDDDIGFIGGLQTGTVTLPMALKAYTANQSLPTYTTSYSGKWGIGGTAWTNTPMALGYDTFLGYWGDSIESCDGWVPMGSVPGTGGAMMRAVPGYWKQNMTDDENEWCDELKKLEPSGLLSPHEVKVACHTTPIPRPSKIIDRELLNHTREIIRNHDYSNGPLMHMHATQILHLPLQYPKEYDVNNTWYENKTMPQPDNDILRLKTNNMLKFMDDIFGGIMESIKETGQWNNTIVWFGTDNGGAIYSNSANNNYPLRGSKLSSFEGGLRVPQFLSGGWIDKHIDAGVNRVSNTYVVVNDWAPTFLGMVGNESARSFLPGTDEGPAYGHNLWEYIKNSVGARTLNDQNSDGNGNGNGNAYGHTKGNGNAYGHVNGNGNAFGHMNGNGYDHGSGNSYGNPANGPHQKERLVTYSPTLSLSITEDSTKKYIGTRNHSQFFARHWAPIWPTNNDVIPDFGYASIRPCRPNGTAMDCCLFDISIDEYELEPQPTDCEVHAVMAKNGYNKGICNSTTKTDPLCVKKISLPTEEEQDVYSLWTLYNASGPFTNRKGHPINASTVGEEYPLCTCSVVEAGTDLSTVDRFIPGMESPAICFNSGTTKMDRNETKYAIECRGLSRTPYNDGSYYDSYEAEGFNKTLVEAWFEADRRGRLERFHAIPDLTQMLYGYITRNGTYGEFPNYIKYPFVAAGMDTCSAKNVTPVTIPPLSLTPWAFTQGDVTHPKTRPELSMCNPYSLTKNFCIAKQNPLQKLIKLFNYSRDDPYFKFQNDTVVKAYNESQCEDLCPPTAEGTAYIGNNRTKNWGMAV